ncbi:MAG: HIT family protein [Candidatus Bathyarchaeia archaeon]
MAIDESCIFCQIAAKNAPSSIIYEDEAVLAFLDIRPLNMGHTLVIPKTHYVDVFDIPENELCKVYLAAKKMSGSIKKATCAQGISIFQQNGTAAGQDIFHLHVHVVPRFMGQTLPRFSELEEAKRSMLDEMAAKIRLQL